MRYRDFTDMPVWHIPTQPVVVVCQLTASLSKREHYGQCGQLRDAAWTITGNIAEGFGCRHAKDTINFFFFRSSASEVKGHLFAGQAIGSFTEE